MFHSEPARGGVGGVRVLVPSLPGQGSSRPALLSYLSMSPSSTPCHVPVHAMHPPCHVPALPLPPAPAPACPLAHVRESAQPVLPAGSPSPLGIFAMSLPCPCCFEAVPGILRARFLAGPVISGGFGLFRALWVCRGGSGLWPARALAGLLGVVSCPLSAPCSGVGCLVRSRWRSMPALAVEARLASSRSPCCEAWRQRVGYGGGLPDWWAARWPISGLGCQWRG